ncbi:hypothetical protein GCM10029992_24850 [Glycomyces albus]
MILLGCVEIDGLAVELVWSRLSDTVLADFRDVEPRRIGTAVFRDRPKPVFIAQPGHLDWLGYESREARILEAAACLYRNRSRVEQGAARGRWSPDDCSNGPGLSEARPGP